MTVSLVCTFDNPATCARECWQDGRLLCAYQEDLFFLKRWPIPASLFFFGANIGPWRDGQLVGDAMAIAPGADGRELAMAAH